MPRSVATFLMFDGVAEEAMNFYVSLFAGAEVRSMEKWKASEQGSEGSIKRAHLTIGGHELMVFDSPAKHDFTFTPAISLFVECASEEELDKTYAALSAGGKIYMPLDNYGFSKKFGWVGDRFGVTWQLNWA